MGARQPKSSQVVLITGAGAGLGESMARRFHQAGAHIIACDLHGDRVEGLAQTLGSRVSPHAMDVTQKDDWARVVSDLKDRHGHVDVLINNAGVAAAGQLDETPIEDWQWVIDIDLMGVVMGCQSVLGLMRAQRRGHIINVASVAGLASAPEINAYGTAKAAVIAMSEMLRAEVHEDGIEVSALCPAFVKTRLTETMRARDAHYEKRVNRWMERSGVSAEDVAEVVYQATLKPKFMLLTHPKTRWLWRLKRFFPELYFKLVLRGARQAKRKKAKT